ncbi:hypothetical protein Q1695_003740 [Nippostrongylus brasiliensis]|nr:hypothetical protein Q1695_003740 [Nippostrongylus brasiliensis]
MSNFVHCMVCFVFPVEGVKFFLSTCGHVACVRCVQKGAMTLKCKVCRKDNPQILEINRNLKPHLREMFTPLVDFSTISRECANMEKIQLGKEKELRGRFEKLQQFCKEQMGKKQQYKERCSRLEAEYKKKYQEAEELKNKIAIMKNSSMRRVHMVPSLFICCLDDLTHDPFRTPMLPSRRSFTTSTPFKHPHHRAADATESTIHATHQTDTTGSFSAAGIPVMSMDSGGEVSTLARMTSAMCRDSTASNDTWQNNKSTSSILHGDERIFPPSAKGHHGEEKPSTSHNVGTSVINDNSGTKTPVTKRSRLDIMSKTQPLPMKSIDPQ